MEDSGQELNPFSREKAWRTWLENRDAALRLREEIREGRESGDPTRAQLLRSAEIIGRLTDNTILLPIVRRALETRDQVPEEAGGPAKENA